jgi:MFS family permease
MQEKGPFHAASQLDERKRSRGRAPSAVPLTRCPSPVKGLGQIRSPRMRQVLELLRTESRARLFFFALTQSAIGTGAGYVALLLIAFERYESAWSITLVLLADFLPAMLLGPVFGAAADRWSRRGCMVTSDVVRALAFIGIAVVDSYVATLAFALLAGVGTGLFAPAALASLPSVVKPQHAPAATALYGVTADIGFTVGPAIAALGLLLVGPEELTLINGLTFAVSAVILVRLPFGAVSASVEAATGAFELLREARDGLRVLATTPGARAVIAGSSAALFFGGLFNVAELPFATTAVGAGGTGFSVLVTSFGVGFIAGSISGSNGGSVDRLRRRFLLGISLDGVGVLLCAMSPTMLVAVPAFALAGLGNGMYLVHERVFLQQTVPERFLARAYGVKNALASWGFGLAFLTAGGLLSLTDARAVFWVAGAGALFAAAVTGVILNRSHRPMDLQPVRRDGETRIPSEASGYVEAPTR